MTSFKRFAVLLFILGFSCTALFAQNETTKWYFGNKAGLDFMTSPPTLLTNGAMTTSEGCATMSDGAGNLLFYTDGVTVYDKTHVAMANGTGLLGFSSSSQSAIIVKQPGNPNIYFVFTQGAINNGVRYSTLDISLASGNGSVTAKNATLSIPSSEKLTSVKHCNGNDVWVVTHDNTSNVYKSFLVTSAGVNPVPVTSSVGISYLNIDYIGCLKLSPNGRKIACGLYGGSACFEVCDFDNATGVVSNPLTLGSSLTQAYGCEFSPDGSKLYGTRYGSNALYQWDLCAGSPTAIAASMFTIASTAPGKAQLQLAVDGKIYVAAPGQQSISVINTPNASGSACNFVPSAIPVGPNMSTFGMPNFINSFFKPALQPFTYSLSCNTATFSTPAISNTINMGCGAVASVPASVQWSFGDPASGAANTSTLNSPAHTYPGTGSYSVEVVYYNTCSNDTLRSVVTITNTAPSLSLTGTFTICAGEKRVYTASGASSYTWHNGATTPSIALSPSVTTTFSLSGAGSNSCLAKKSFTITVNKCTGIEPVTGDRSFFIYPNPAKSTLYVETASTARIRILDKSGELLLERWFESGHHSMDISSFSAGIYVVQCITGKSVKTLRLVKLE